MAEFVLTDPFISIGGNDVSDHFTSVALPVEAETQEATAFGDEWRTRLGRAQGLERKPGLQPGLRRRPVGRLDVAPGRYQRGSGHPPGQRGRGRRITHSGPATPS